MTVHYFSGRKPAIVPNLRIPGSCIEVPGTFINIEDHYAPEYRALGISIIEIERALYGDRMGPLDIGFQMGKEEYWPNFERWKAQSETPQTIDVIPRAEEIGYTVSSRERRTADGKFVHDYKVSVPLNRVGVNVSKAEDVRQAVNNYLVDNCFQITDEAQLLDRFMNSKGYSLKHDIKSFRVGGIPENAIAAVHLKDHFFAFSNNFRNMIARAAKAHGVEYEDEKFYTVLHELIHLYGVNSERELENLALEFYLTIANKEPHGYTNQVRKSERSEKQKYLAKARIPLSRLASQGKKPSFKNIEAVVEKLYEEAEEEGLSEQETQNYINTHLEVYEKAEETDYKEGKEQSEETRDIEASKEATDGETAEEAAEAEGGEAEGGGEAPE